MSGTWRVNLIDFERKIEKGKGLSHKEAFVLLEFTKQQDKIIKGLEAKK